MYGWREGAKWGLFAPLYSLAGPQNRTYFDLSDSFRVRVLGNPHAGFYAFRKIEGSKSASKSWGFTLRLLLALLTAQNTNKAAYLIPATRGSYGSHSYGARGSRHLASQRSQKYYDRWKLLWRGDLTAFVTLTKPQLGPITKPTKQPK